MEQQAQPSFPPHAAPAAVGVVAVVVVRVALAALVVPGEQAAQVEQGAAVPVERWQSLAAS
jgi:hypothetical protein